MSVQKQSAVGTGSEPLQFQPLSSAVDIPFWNLLGRNKLEHHKLSEKPLPLVGSYTCSTHPSVPGQLNIADYAFDANPTLPARHFRVSGLLHNANNTENFKAFDKTAILNATAKQIWEDITSGRAIANPNLLGRFVALSYADLKSHAYVYWFGFPALVLDECVTTSAIAPIAGAGFSGPEITAIHHSFTALARANLSTASTTGSGGSTDTKSNAELPPYFLVVIRGSGSERKVSAFPLSAFSEQKKSLTASDEIVLAFVDSCALPTHPGWPLRNLLTLAASQFGITSSRVICWRDLDAPNPAAANAKSLILSVRFGLSNPQVMPRAVGWEPNKNGRAGARAVDLRALMDDRVLAETSVDLNLKLMRWRALPSLDLPLIARTKCLLLGAGTLGCAIARTLLAWGVRHITFVDNGKVSYSNPVRQSLFTHEDCIGGGKPKAAAAAAALTRIFPGVKSEGHKLTIPMPGHSVPVGSQEAKDVENDYNKLCELIASHDAVFLGTDSRESRWLPTLICAATLKCCINTALGFDTFVVMRHGDNDSSPPPEQTASAAVATSGGDQKSKSVDSKSVSGSVSEAAAKLLGCYFCNDVVGPGDSMSDRTLDQQCTVTRPGLAPIASAYAVELFIALLHHPLKHRASASVDPNAADVDSKSNPFGPVPHQLRGFLGSFNVTIVLGQQFDKCTACSTAITNQYRKRGFALLLDALNKPASFLEDISGLTALKKATEASTAALGWDADGDESAGDDF